LIRNDSRLEPLSGDISQPSFPDWVGSKNWLFKTFLNLKRPNYELRV